MQQQIKQATSPQQKVQFKNQLNNVHQEISNRTQKQLKAVAEEDPKIKQLDLEPDRSMKR
ncbi:LtrC-like protein (plasmid) [Levilactobacillus brevis]|nr:LtrC-like protein [Levilactobacillus brevis]ARN96582.1 LtrC-like protein [Levilactobacillus brevis]